MRKFIYSGGNHINIIEIPIDLKEDDIWKVMGAKEDVHNQLNEEVSSALTEICNLSSPLAVYETIKVKAVDDSGIEFKDGTYIHNKFARHLFDDADEAIFLLVTIGSEVDLRIAQLIESGLNIEAVVMDYGGIAASFNTFTNALGLLRSLTESQGKKMGVCLRPGNKYWDISGQATIFSVLSAEKIGVQLLESSFMKPTKSQSGIIPSGYLLEKDNSENGEMCSSCPSLKCPLRNVYGDSSVS